MAGKVIMVASGKGGTGKSTVCVLLAAELAARGPRVLRIELDLEAIQALQKILIRKLRSSPKILPRYARRCLNNVDTKHL